MTSSRIFITILALCLAITVSGCCTPMETLRFVAGNSTKSIEDSRSSALVKIYGYDYGTCYVKVEEILKNIPNVSIYRKDESMIAVHYNSVNITPVGVFFKEVDSSHTRVEISSPSRDAREYISKSVFSGEVQKDTDKLVVEVRKPVGGKY